MPSSMVLNESSLGVLLHGKMGTCKMRDGKRREHLIHALTYQEVGRYTSQQTDVSNTWLKARPFTVTSIVKSKGKF